MVLTFNYASLKEVFPFVAAQVPPFIAEDPDYIYKVDTVSHVVELGYKDDDWVLD